jgi:hypothetical protein
VALGSERPEPRFRELETVRQRIREEIEEDTHSMVTAAPSRAAILIHQRESQSLARAIREIREKVLEDFQSERERYDRPQAAPAETGIPLPALPVCGKGTQEIRHTKLLRHFLGVQPTYVER